MDSERDISITDDEYFSTAVQIFDYCNAASNGSLRVDTLMEKIAPFVKANRSESSLRALLDPDQENPEITVKMLSNTLSKYSENQKVDLDESFNFKSGPVPQDSDSGISSDGFQLVEELQCELREKERLAAQLRVRLEAAAAAHDDALSAAAAERDALRAHINMIREENASLQRVRTECEEVAERLSASEERQLELRRALDAANKRTASALKSVAALEEEKQNLQDNLNKSKDECHGMNEMYARRQALLIVQNEALRTECAELSARLADNEEVMQQLITEKLRIEMELKEQVNKWTLHPLRLDRSMDISCGDEQMLSALDSLNNDSRFQQNATLDEVSFFFEDPGRATNISLFDEIRLSFGNVSKLREIDETRSERNFRKDVFGLRKFEVESAKVSEKCDAETQYDIEEVNADIPCKNADNIDVGVNDETQCRDNGVRVTQTKFREIELKHIGIQYEPINFKTTETQCDSKDFGLNNIETQCGPIDFGLNTTETQCTSKDFGINSTETQCSSIDFGLKSKETQCTPTHFRKTIETQCNSRDFGLKNIEIQCTPKDFGLKTTETQCTLKDFGHSNVEIQCTMRDCEVCNIETQCGPKDIGLKDIPTQYEPNEHKNAGTQCDADNNNNNPDTECKTCDQCTECDKLKGYTTKLRRDVMRSRKIVTDLKSNMNACESNLKLLKKLNDEEKEENECLKSSVKGLNEKLLLVEKTASMQKYHLESLSCYTVSSIRKIEPDIADSSTQADAPCDECVARSKPAPRTLRRRIWDGVKSIFSLMALLCFGGAICFLYQVSQYHFAARRCAGAERPLQWSWMRLGDLLDAVFRIEYVGEVPM